MSTQLKGREGLPQSCPCTRCHSANTDHPSPPATLILTRTLGGPVLVRFSAAVTDTAGGGKGLSACRLQVEGPVLATVPLLLLLLLQRDIMPKAVYQRSRVIPAGWCP